MLADRTARGFSLSYTSRGVQVSDSFGAMGPAHRRARGSLGVRGGMYSEGRILVSSGGCYGRHGVDSVWRWLYRGDLLGDRAWSFGNSSRDSCSSPLFAPGSPFSR